MKVIKEVNYINDMGHNKKIVIFEPKDDKYPFELWSNQTGDWCGNGKKTKEELNEYFEHYHVFERM